MRARERTVQLPSIDLSAYTANIPPKQRMALGVICAVLMIVVYWQLFLRSERAARSEAQAELDGLKAQAEQGRKIANQNASLAQEIKALEALLQETVMKLPAEKEIPSLLKRIVGLGWETDLDVAVFKPGSPVTKEFYAEVPVQLKVVGTYHNLGTLFERLSRLERIVNVTNLTIRPAGKDQKPEENSIQADFGVATYLYHRSDTQ